MTEINGSTEMKKCPYCAEEIQSDAVKCKHCGEWLDNGREMQNYTFEEVHIDKEDKRTLEFVLGLIGGIIGILAAFFQMFFGSVGEAFGAAGYGEITLFGIAALLLSVWGIVGAVIVRSNSKHGSLIMITAAIGGFISSFMLYIIPGILLMIAGIIGIRKNIQEGKRFNKGLWIGINLAVLILLFAGIYVDVNSIFELKQEEKVAVDSYDEANNEESNTENLVTAYSQIGKTREVAVSALEEAGFNVVQEYVYNTIYRNNSIDVVAGQDKIGEYQKGETITLSYKKPAIEVFEVYWEETGTEVSDVIRVSYSIRNYSDKIIDFISVTTSFYDSEGRPFNRFLSPQGEDTNRVIGTYYGTIAHGYVETIIIDNSINGYFDRTSVSCVYPEKFLLYFSDGTTQEIYSSVYWADYDYRGGEPSIRP